MVKFKNQKTVILGMNGSGKTEFGKWLCATQFKRPVWFLVNHDDLKGMPKNVVIAFSETKTIKELNQTVEAVMKLAEENKVDAIIIDEADLFLDNNADVDKYQAIRELVILQRHKNLSVVVMSRRPANLPTKLYETSDNVVIFASPRSDNVERKFKSLDKELPEMVSTLQKGDYRYIIFTVGKIPQFYNPIPYKETQKVKGGKEENGNTAKS